MAFSNPRRLAFVSVPVIALAVLLLFQAISSVTIKRAPELSISLMPTNGLAREQYAFSEFSSRVTDPNETQSAAEFASGDAVRALRSDPLAPKAYAILAMAEPDGAKGRQIVTLASQLNRRDLSLQSLWLREKLAENSFSATVEALDRILRVHPQYRDQFFPVLGEALEDEGTIPQFAQFLDGEAPWQARFLSYAVGQRQLQPNLALLRTQIEVQNNSVDRRLIVGLVRQGLYSEAHDLYTYLIAQPDPEAEIETGTWRSTYPPFDWYFADKTGFRAQQSLDAQSLEISVRPGKGGVIAERFIRAPLGQTQIRVAHSIAPAEQLRDVRLQANCAGSGTPFFDERFMPGEVVFELPEAPPECEFISLVINARAWSGRSSLSGTIESFEIESVNGLDLN